MLSAVACFLPSGATNTFQGERQRINKGPARKGFLEAPDLLGDDTKESKRLTFTPEPSLTPAEKLVETLSSSKMTKRNSKIVN